MLALRLLSGTLLLAATIAFISELTRAQLGIAGAPLTPLVTQLGDAAPALLASLQRTVQGWHPLLWDPALRSLLAVPAWISLGLAGLILGWLGRRRSRANVFTN